MKFNLKNRPRPLAYVENVRIMEDWFEGFEKKHTDFYCSSYLVENWLCDNELVNNPDVARAIRVFIKTEVFGE